MPIAAPDQAPAGGRIVERIKKLLAHANEGSGATEAEMDTAMALAQEMAFKYNLDIALIQRDDAQRSGENDMGQEDVDLGARHIWKRDLMDVLAREYFCATIYRSNRVWVEGRHVEAKEDKWGKMRRGYYTHGHYAPNSKTMVTVLVGSRDNIAVVTALYGWVYTQIRRLATEEGRKIDYRDPETGKHIDHLRFLNSFAAGAVSHIGQRLYEARQELQKKYAGSGAMVVSNRAALSKYIKETWPKLGGVQNTKRSIDGYASGRGRERARDIDLDMRQFGGGRDGARQLNHSQTVRELVG